MFHSIRLLDMGYEIAKNGGVKYPEFLGKKFYYIRNVFECKDWVEINSIMKTIFNACATKFKKVAPKKWKSLQVTMLI